MRLPTIRICLAASGGGHLRQLLDLEPTWKAHDHFFITEDSALSRTVSKDHPVQFVAHFALGQAQLGAPLKMIAAAARNFVQSARIIFQERPDVIISTGAGAMYFSVMFARLFGARVVVIESFARFDRPSVFFRLASVLAHHTVVQSAALSKFAPRAAVFDPFKMLDGPRPAKQARALATVGATLPFNRLVTMVAAVKASGDLPEDVLVQTGRGGAHPSGVEVRETLPFDEMNAQLDVSDILICHGGTGSLITGLRHGCRVIAIPRQMALGEHYDNHQREIVSAFVARGLISAANTVEELRAALVEQRSRTPVMATTDPQGLMEHLRTIFDGIGADRRIGPSANAMVGE